MPAENQSYTVVALMSGSSLDGVDVALIKITTGDLYRYTIIDAETIQFTDAQLQFIKSLVPDIHSRHREAHAFFADIFIADVKTFLQKHQGIHIDFIASHGHTLFHFPAQGITCQLGDAQMMAEALRLPVIANFRQADIDAGGQGAPLVPICDATFFSAYDACLNLGGIANISFNTSGGRVGFDICACNQLLNHFAHLAGLEYDPEGELAAAGEVDEEALQQLSEVPYLQLPWPKSLDNFFVQRAFIEPLHKTDGMLNDKLATATEHIAMEIAAVIIAQPKRRPLDDYQLLVTGGGAFNNYLIKKIEEHAGIRIVLPDQTLIQYKETLAMALMGVLRFTNQPNFLPSVTGAKVAVSGGEIATF